MQTMNLVCLRRLGTYAVVTAILLSPLLASSTNAGAGIPHENYTLVGDNIDALIGLLNLSIVYSEFALQSMYDENMQYVEQNLSVVRGLIAPAEQLLGEIADVAPSYSNLSSLLPPFGNLSAQEDSFAVMEAGLLEARDDVVDSSLLANLTEDAFISAVQAIERFNLLLTQMNKTIDDMLVSANQIIALEVDGERPFADNNLIPLIERLKDLLHAIDLEVNYIFHDVINWDETKPFIILWLGSNTYYLGEVITGGGYLHLNSSFAADKTVKILFDGRNLTSATTSTDGRYTFSYPIPLDASWLGVHVMAASYQSLYGTLISDPLTIDIVLIPTFISLKASPTLMEITDSLNLSISLVDIRGLPVTQAEGNLSIDSEIIPFTTAADGSFSYSRAGSVLGFGTHNLAASYDGEVPYKGSSSHGVRVVVDIPTNISLLLFSPRIRPAQHIVGNGTLLANGTSPIPGQQITIFIDGTETANFTTNDRGEFVFTLEQSNLSAGTHVLRAAFMYKDDVWRYSQVEATFTVASSGVSKYPFFPFFPNWGRFLPGAENVTYVFIGKYAYFAWLLILALMGTAVKIAQVSKKRRAAKRPTAEPLVPAAITEKESVLSGQEFSASMVEIEGGSFTPNERVIRYYRALINFMSKKRRLDIRANMTHWEIAGLMSSLGYPAGSVERITHLFERALYSGQLLDDEDTVEMSANMSRVIGARLTGVANAG